MNTVTIGNRGAASSQRTKPVRLIAPLVHFVDDSGFAEFAPRKPDQPVVPHVTTSVLVPRALEPRLLEILPRDPHTNRHLKSTDRGMTPALATRFVEDLLSLDVALGIVLINESDETSIATARKAKEATDARRRAEKRRLIPMRTIMTWLFSADAISKAWGANAKSKLSMATLTDVVLDRANYKHEFERECRASLTSAFSKHGTVVGQLEWKSRTEEPLLHMPDLISGLIRRRALTREFHDAMRMIEEAAQRKQVEIQDGRQFYTL